MSVSVRNCEMGGLDWREGRLALYRLFSFAPNVSTCLSYFSLVTTLLVPCITESRVFVICISLGNFALPFLLGNRSSVWNTIPFHDQCHWRWGSPLLLYFDFCLRMFIYLVTRKYLPQCTSGGDQRTTCRSWLFLSTLVDRDWIRIVNQGSKSLNQLTSFSAPESIVLFKLSTYYLDFLELWTIRETGISNKSCF